MSIRSSLSSFEMNKVKSFPAPTIHFPLIFLSSLSIAGKVALVINLGKTSLQRGLIIIFG